MAPEGTGYRLSVSGAPVNPSGGAIPSGGTANWALGVLAIPDGISGQELAAFGAPEGTATLSGPHALDAGTLKTAKGFSGSVGGDGKISYKAGDGALLGNSNTQTFPKPLPPISQGTGGDGHVPILVGTKVFAFYHHSDPTSATCVDRATGDGLPGLPEAARQPRQPRVQQHRQQRPGASSRAPRCWSHLLVQSSRVASIGLFCWDESTDSTCGYTIVDRGTSQGSANASAPIRSSDGNAWFAADTGKAYCVDPATGATCGSIANPLPKDVLELRRGRPRLARVLLARSDGQSTCIDTSTRAVVRGWTAAQTFSGAWNLVNRHSATGEANGICVFLGQNGSCMADDDPSPAGRTAVNNFVHFEPHYSGSLRRRSSVRGRWSARSTRRRRLLRLVVPAGPPRARAATTARTARPGWLTTTSDGGAARPGAYGVTSDGSCGIALGDRGPGVTPPIRRLSPCVSLGSGTERTTIDLRDQRCDRSVGAASWRNVVLSDTDDEEMESVVVTVRDAATGEVLKSAR